MGKSWGTRASVTCLALAGLAALLSSCPASLSDPQRFYSTDSCPAGTYVPTDIFQADCALSGCHTSNSPAGGLDLQSPNVASRLINQPSSTCPGQILILSPDAGFLFEKLQANPPCGSQMPLDMAPLSSPDIQCIEDWVASVLDGGT